MNRRIFFKTKVGFTVEELEILLNDLKNQNTTDRLEAGEYVHDDVEYIIDEDGDIIVCC